ncbi:DNA polymerase III subunit epsilon [Pseudoteredinibacter isoporae]|uniref:DNA polymerase III subunit epsilon n=1 Tax=Pseudoteredinibacter isoporae TaxID=570281 RepID=A0A7X0JSM9_9GAMM|nr:DNA polymerase-3 subunit epsilon [Pseudoteredinibacter isoporae]NHO87117.1 DNA polymerase III subunit epsilon [Pseudoteredinibacter isoporae]NIB22941.1 DNA polymerase III subunit epsilon [Pseudoteredinibacter isoporae]
MRQIVLDTETTGIDPKSGHRIIEIGCVELMNRKLTGRHYHEYINPQRIVEDEAIEVHGITNEFLADKPVFSHVADSFLEFIRGAELVIHNAPFDVGFIDHEFALLGQGHGRVDDHCSVIDTLVMARDKHPGQRNSLDALCKRYGVDNSGRVLHGALLDSEILADVYLMMTGGQTMLSLGAETEENAAGQSSAIRRLNASRPALRVVSANADELQLHEQKLDSLGEDCLWRR